MCMFGCECVAACYVTWLCLLVRFFDECQWGRAFLTLTCQSNQRPHLTLILHVCSCHLEPSQLTTILLLDLLVLPLLCLKFDIFAHLTFLVLSFVLHFLFVLLLFQPQLQLFVRLHIPCV